MKDVTDCFTVNKFPAGETQITLSNPNFRHADHVFFTVRNEDAMDLMGIAQRVDLIRRVGIRKISISLPYLPYSRQDRYTDQFSAFALKSYAKFLNSLGFYQVITWDAHSGVSDLIDNLVNRCISHRVYNALKLMGKDAAILIPDAGAAKKISALIRLFDNPPVVYTASKVRDPSTGAITDTYVPDIPEDVPVLVVDDLCDGGRTFIEIAKRLPNRKQLFVTHGVFSKPDVFDAFELVYTTDSYKGHYDAPNLITHNL